TLAFRPSWCREMKYSQPARAASSRRDFSLSDSVIKRLPVRSPKISHPPEHAVGPRLAQDCLAVTRPIMAASHKAPNRHAGRLPRLDATHAVLDDEGAMRIRLHPFGCVEEEVGRRFAARHHLRCIKPRIEMRGKPGQRKREGHPIDVAGRGNTMRDAQVLEYRLYPFNRAQRGKKRSANPRLQLGRKLLGDCASQ